jgi:phosphate transport system permease protein
MTFSSPFRAVKNNLMTLLMVAATLAVLTPLGIIFIHILKMGASSLSLEFFTQIPKPTG